MGCWGLPCEQGEVFVGASNEPGRELLLLEGSLYFSESCLQQKPTNFGRILFAWLGGWVVGLLLFFVFVLGFCFFFFYF